MGRAGAVCCLLSGAMVLAGCAHAPPSEAYGTVTPIHGMATVLAVNVYMRTAALKTSFGRQKAWWNSGSAFYAGGTVGRVLQARKGQRIRFDGLYSDGEIFLSKTWLLPGR